MKSLQFSGPRQPRALAGPRATHPCSFRCASSSYQSPEAVVSTRPIQATRTALYDVAEACCSQSAATTAPVAQASSSLVPWAVAGGVALAALAIKRVYDTPSRSYENNVGDEYDAWTEEGILEYYWGEHIHLGYYTDEELKKGWWTADFKAAKLRFTEEMYRFSGAEKPKRILDVGCGFGGSSRWMAKQNPQGQVTGITLSPRQVARGGELAKEQGLSNVEFKVMDALALEFEDNTFDLVWACESGEHMPDKKRYIEEMTRVLKPGGKLVIACWCQREERPDQPLSEQDKANLQFLYEEWAHPYFISIEEFCRLMQGTGQYAEVGSDDWTRQTIASWRHSNLVGVLDPWFVIFKFNPSLWYKVTREIVTLERMHRAFDRGLMQYGMMRGTKAPGGAQLAQKSEVQQEGQQQVPAVAAG